MRAHVPTTAIVFALCGCTAEVGEPVSAGDEVRGDFHPEGSISEVEDAPDAQVYPIAGGYAVATASGTMAVRLQSGSDSVDREEATLEILVSNRYVPAADFEYADLFLETIQVSDAPADVAFRDATGEEASPERVLDLRALPDDILFQAAAIGQSVETAMADGTLTGPDSAALPYPAIPPTAWAPAVEFQECEDLGVRSLALFCAGGAVLGLASGPFGIVAGCGAGAAAWVLAFMANRVWNAFLNPNFCTYAVPPQYR